MDQARTRAESVGRASRAAAKTPRPFRHARYREHTLRSGRDLRARRYRTRDRSAPVCRPLQASTATRRFCVVTDRRYGFVSGECCWSTLVVSALVWSHLGFLARGFAELVGVAGV